MTQIEISTKFIAEVEGYSSKPYKDPKGIWTIGHGFTKYLDNSRVSGNDPSITIEESKIILTKIVTDLYDKIFKLEAYTGIFKYLNNNQQAAIISFCYNIGMGNYKSSSLRKYINTNSSQYNPMELKRLFCLFCKCTINNKLTFIQGLLNRRLKEYELFIK